MNRPHALLDDGSTRRYLPLEVGALVRRARGAMSLRRAAARTGVSGSMISRIERGLRTPSVTSANMIADGLFMLAAARAELLRWAVDDAGRDWQPDKITEW